jgi:sigma-54 specific flagellar transcriptional regulator A
VSLDSLIGQSESILSLKGLVASVAHSDATVLVIGESGTGKELVARALHDHSGRNEARFVPVNCGAIPRDLIESELFGHRRGAFTGAISDRTGRFELAQGGTLFLDEIGDLPIEMQVKLLRVLQERIIDPVGSSKAIAIDVRVVAATHKDLETEVAAGRFREDLYYRLNVLPLTTPPLRERPEDIEALCVHFVRVHAHPHRGAVEMTPVLVETLRGYAWPGNIRELSNLIARFSALFAGQTICYPDVPQVMLPKGLREIQPRGAKRQIGQGSVARATPATAKRSDSPPAATTARAPQTSVPAAAVEASVVALAQVEAPHVDGPLCAEDFLSPPDYENGKSGPIQLRAETESGKTLPAYLSGLTGSTPSESWPRPPVTRQPVIPAPSNLTSPSPRIAPGEFNPIEDLIALAQGAPLPALDAIPLKKRISDLEKALIEQALTQADGNVSQTARILNIQRTTLIEKINKYNLRFKGDESNT